MSLVLRMCDYDCVGEAGMGNAERPRLDHSRWTEKLRMTYVNGDLARFNMLGQQYQEWCHRNGVVTEELGLDSLDVPAPTPSTSSALVVASTGTQSGAFGSRPPVKVIAVAPGA